MADISKISIDGGETEYNVKDAVARSEVSAIDEKIPSAATSSNKLVDTATLTTGLAAKADASLIGEANGIATLNGTGKVPESQLPSYVDDVVEGYLYEGDFYEDAQHQDLITPETGKIYIDLETNKTYRWGGSVYVCTGSDLEIGETTGTAFDGGRGKAIEDKIPNNASSSNKLVTASDVAGNVDEEGVEGIIKSTVGFSIVNILNVDAESGSTEINGVTFEVNRSIDGSLQNITVNGTATRDTFFMVASEVTDDDYDMLSGNTYILNGCPEGGSLSSFYLLLEGDYGAEAQDTGEGVLITDVIRNGKLYICVNSGTTLNNAVFYPMIRNKAIKDSTYKRHRNDNVEKQLSKKQDNMTYSYSNGRLTLNTIAEAE